MTYVTTMERRGIQKGVQKGIQKGIQKGAQQTLREDVYEILELRFQTVPYTVKEQLDEIDDATMLRRLHRLAVQAQCIGDFTKEMPH